MAKKKQQLRDQSQEELLSQAAGLDRELFALRNELALQRRLEKPHLIKEKRRQKARILTILTQKQREAL